MTDPETAPRRVAMREGVRHVLRHPFRSLLTALASAVAIAVTVNVISLSQGLAADVQRDVSRFGRRTVDVGRIPIIRPGATRIELGDEALARVRAAVADLGARVVPRRQVAGQARGSGEARQRIQIVGAPETYVATLDIPLVAGRWLSADDDPTRVAALDEQAARDLFPDREPAAVVGATVDAVVDGTPKRLEVVGILADPLTYRALFETFDEGRGARTLTSSLLSFRNLYVLPRLVPGTEYTGISVVLPSEAEVDAARERLMAHWDLDASTGLGDLSKGVGVFVRRDWMDVMGANTDTGALLGNIVWIIIVGVGAILITTLGLVSVRERYDELAIRRCEGATRRHLIWQITAEGIVTSLAGGLAGLPLGFLGADVLRRIVDFPFRFELRYAAVATLVALVLGWIASILPARRAANIQPARVLGRRLT